VPMEKFGLFVALMVLAIIISMITTGLWFCCDDSLAENFSYPPIGTLDFWTVWPATMVFGGIFGKINSSGGKQK